MYQAHTNSQLNPFLADRFGYTVLSHTDLSRETGEAGGINLETFKWGNFDLVVIDESHNFRNNTPGKRDEEGNIIRRSRYQRLMDDAQYVTILGLTPSQIKFEFKCFIKLISVSSKRPRNFLDIRP